MLLPRTLFAAGLLLVSGLLGSANGADNSAPRPNIVLIFCDNLGYGDIEPFGATQQRTPHLLAMEQAGRKFTDFYSASGVCTPSRAALMTGSYPIRNGMAVTDGVVLRPVSQIGLHPQEWTVAEQLKSAGYATAAFGKWHLGDQPPFLPTNQGFDFFHGIPYSDDMTPEAGRNYPANGHLWPPLPLMLNAQVVEAPADRDLLAQKLTVSACEWIVTHKDEPFFLYFPQCMPGSTRAPFASEAFQGRSQNGPWGDSIEEIDWSLGEMVATLQECDLLENTLIVWTSDNGAPRRNPIQGTNFPLAGWGYTTREGGMRVPCLMQWPAQMPAGTICTELATMMDFLPTFAALSGSELPADRIIDGHDITPLLVGNDEATSPYEAFFYYQGRDLQAVRAGDWKLYVQPPVLKGRDDPFPRDVATPLFNVSRDPGETTDRSGEHPEIVRRLLAAVENVRPRLGDGDQIGSEVRPHGIVEHPQPLRLTR